MFHCRSLIDPLWGLALVRWWFGSLVDMAGRSFGRDDGTKTACLAGCLHICLHVGPVWPVVVFSELQGEVGLLSEFGPVKSRPGGTVVWIRRSDEVSRCRLLVSVGYGAEP